MSQTMNPVANVMNASGGQAYATPNRELIARIVLESRTAPNDMQVVGHLHTALLSETSPDFIVKAAQYAAHVARNKDIAGMLTAFLYIAAKLRTDARERVVWFNAATTALDTAVLDLATMRSFFAYYRGNMQKQHARWGYVGNVGGRLQKDLRRWFNNHPLHKLIKGRAGTSPTTRDMLRMVHPKSENEVRNNVYRWIAKGEVALPNHELVVSMELLKQGNMPSPESDVWKLPFDVLAPQMGANTEAWQTYARRVNPSALLKHLNTFARHLVYADNPDLIAHHVAIMTNPENQSAFNPYNVWRAMENLDESVPEAIKAGLEGALEISCSNIEPFTGELTILVDVSGSMQSPLGAHRGRISALRRCDAAALILAAIHSASSSEARVEIIPFDTDIRNSRSLANARTTKEMANVIAGYRGGGTNIGMAFEYLAARTHTAPNVILISDNESLPCFDTRGPFRGDHNRANTAWRVVQGRQEDARLLLVDVCPAGNQVAFGPGIQGISGYGEATQALVSKWLAGNDNTGDPMPEMDVVAEIENFVLTPRGETE